MLACVHHTTTRAHRMPRQAVLREQPRARVQGGHSRTAGAWDGDEADADEREGAAGVAAGPGEGRQSDPSRGSEARHAHAHATLASSTAHAHTQAHSSRKRRKHRDMHVTPEMQCLEGNKCKFSSKSYSEKERVRERD